jgi:hypothetical protein
LKILLDERLPLDFRHSFPEHEAHTVQRVGLKSRKNGELPGPELARKTRQRPCKKLPRQTESIFLTLQRKNI